jgi:hypothetical protein
MIKDEDLSRSFQILDNLQPGEVLELERIAKERRELFIRCAEQYQKTFGTLELNDSKSKIKKYEKFANIS